MTLATMGLRERRAHTLQRRQEGEEEPPPVAWWTVTEGGARGAVVEKGKKAGGYDVWSPRGGTRQLGRPK
jgi:hypothetical protein